MVVLFLQSVGRQRAGAEFPIPRGRVFESDASVSLGPKIPDSDLNSFLAFHTNADETALLLLFSKCSSSSHQSPLLNPKQKPPPVSCLRRRRLRSEHRWSAGIIHTHKLQLQSSLHTSRATPASRYLGASAPGSRSTSWLLAMDGGQTPATTHNHKAPPPFVPDGELVELLWQDGAVVAHSQAHHHHHHHHHRLLQVGAGNTGASGVTGEPPPPPPALPWLPCSTSTGGGGGGSAMGGDVYSQLWQSIASGAPVARPPAKSGNSGGAGSSRTAGEVGGGSSFCGSNLVAAALHLDDDDDDDIDDVGVGVAEAALPMPMPMPLDDDPGASGAGGSTSSGWNGNAMPKRSRDEFDEDADLDTVDETPPPSSRRPASSKRRTRAAEVHNMSERRRRDRINEKMRALQELVPHCNKTDKASILDEAIEYLKSLQMQLQIMWMSTGMAPMVIPGAQQLMPPMATGFNSARMPPPAVQFLSQMQRVPQPQHFMSNPLQNQMPQILPPPTNAPSATDQAQSNPMALPRNPFLHHHDSDAMTAPPQVPSLFGYGPQMVQVNEIQELLTGTAGTDLPSSSDGTGT